MHWENSTGQEWNYKPKYCSHNFRKFKTIGDQNQENDKIVNKDIALQSIGVIRSVWKYKDRITVSGFIFGTGFMLAENILMTCAHNIYSKTKKSFAHEVQFIPGIQKGRVCDQTKFIPRTAYLSNKNPRNFFTYYSTDFVNDSNSELEPAFQQICLIILDPINGGQKQANIPHKFLQIGSIEEKKQPLKLRIYGYPSDKFKYQIKFQKAVFERYQIDGFLHSIGSFQIGQYTNKSNLNVYKIDQIINHTMDTRVGCSGSPILATNDQNQLYVVGIHTHKGRENDYNSGVYFGKHMIKLIKQLEQKLQLYVKNKFPQRKEKISYYCSLQQEQKYLVSQIKQKNESDESSQESHAQSNINSSRPAKKQDDSRESSQVSHDQRKIFSSRPSKKQDDSKESSQEGHSQIKKKSSQSAQKQDDSRESSQYSKIDKNLFIQQIESQKKQEEEAHESSSEFEISSQYSSCIDEDFIDNFYQFLAIEKVSSPQNQQSFEYSAQASNRVLISLITIYYLPNSKFLLLNTLEVLTKEYLSILEDKQKHKSEHGCSGYQGLYLLSK